jgi:hypothetical protein
VFSEVYFKKMIFRSKGRVHSEAGDFIRRLFALGIIRVMCSDYIQCASCSFLLLSVPVDACLLRTAISDGGEMLYILNRL